MLIHAANVLNYARNYRVCYLGGRYGGGKTSFAFRLAYDLCQYYGFRYILSNVRSVWNTEPRHVTLRDGVYIDAVFVLDEGGMYLDNAAQAKSWLAYLRKLNAVLILPSTFPPALLMRRLTVQRTHNFNAWGLPLWVYGIRLDSGIIKQTDWCAWYYPSEIYGIYDTVGMPSQANDLLDYLQDWTRSAASTLNYTTSSRLVLPSSVDNMQIHYDYPAEAEVSESAAFDALNDTMSETQYILEDVRAELIEAAHEARK